jgi:predicted ABC-type ATPase
VSSASLERPFFLVIGGPNGSGKSSLYQTAGIVEDQRSVWIINPDVLAGRIRTAESLEPLAANLEAVKRIEAWLEASIMAHQTIGVETVLSTGKYRRLVALARRLGFEIRLIYLLLDSPRRNLERVRLRVEKGGHAVPDDKVVDRYRRSLDQLPWFLDQADRALIYDNSAAAPRLMAQKRDGVITLDPDALPAVAAAVQSIRTE